MPEGRHLHQATPIELKQRIAAERRGAPFLVYRDANGSQRIAALTAAAGAITVGRDAELDVPLTWDALVSGLHAELRPVGGQWLVVDDGLSRNGTFVNGERVVGRRRLRDADELRLGSTVLIFRQPTTGRRKSTAHAAEPAARPELSQAQRRVLIALCRPVAADDAYARPPTNRSIAEELHLTVAAVKTHLRALFGRFAVDHLPQNEKRAELARRALESGAISPQDLR